MIETAGTSDFVGHGIACKMDCKSTRKIYCLHINLGKKKCQKENMCKCSILRTACMLLRFLWTFFISFHFSDGNIFLDARSYEMIRFPFL